MIYRTNENKIKKKLLSTGENYKKNWKQRVCYLVGTTSTIGYVIVYAVSAVIPFIRIEEIAVHAINGKRKRSLEMSEEKYFYHCLGCNKLLLSEEERRNHKCDVGPNKNGDIFNLEWEKEYLTKYYKNLIKNRFGHTNKYTIENVIKNVKSYLETSELFTGRDLNKIEVFVDKQDPALVHIDIPVEYFHLMFSLNPLDTEVKMIMFVSGYQMCFDVNELDGDIKNSFYEINTKYHYKKFVVLSLVVIFLGTGIVGLFMTNWS